MINWKVRVRQPIFWLSIGAAILSPILAYSQMTYADLTTWDTVISLIIGTFSNPFLLCTVAINLLGILQDPTTKGVSDSQQAMEYQSPKGE